MTDFDRDPDQGGTAGTPLTALVDPAMQTLPQASRGVASCAAASAAWMAPCWSQSKSGSEHFSWTIRLNCQGRPRFEKLRHEIGAVEEAKFRWLKISRTQYGR